MREIVLDTETTGLDPVEGHRIIEIGCVELVDQIPTGAERQYYINPERSVGDSVAIHGIEDAQLTDKPLFAHIVDDLLEFLGDAPLVIHNAGFDLKFLNHEFQRVSRPSIPYARAIDTMEIAKRKLPGARYSLDELCKRFAIDLSSRVKHGALLDAQLTARVYLELAGGRQTRLTLAPVDTATMVVTSEIRIPRIRPEPLIPRITEAEVAAHAAFIADLGAEPVWAWAA